MHFKYLTVVDVHVYIATDTIKSIESSNLQVKKHKLLFFAVAFQPLCITLTSKRLNRKFFRAMKTSALNSKVFWFSFVRMRLYSVPWKELSKSSFLLLVVSLLPENSSRKFSAQKIYRTKFINSSLNAFSCL